MEIDFSQVQEFFDSVEFLYCKPFNSDYYSYSINSIDNDHLIERIELNKMIGLQSRKYQQIDDLTSHFRVFLYIKEPNIFKELNYNESENIYLDKIDEYIHEQLNKQLQPKKTKIEDTKLYQIFKGFSKQFKIKS